MLPPMLKKALGVTLFSLEHIMLKLIQTLTFNNRIAKVYRDTEWGEYRVRFWDCKVYQAGADYHTDDKQDAVDTAITWTTKEYA
jgi:hypothetical protein